MSTTQPKLCSAIVLAVLATSLGGCEGLGRLAYDIGEQDARRQCDRLVDTADWQRCRAERTLDRPRYDKERERLGGADAAQ